MSRELGDPETARKLARAIEAIRRGQSVDRAAAYAILDKRVVLRLLAAVESWLKGSAEVDTKKPRGSPRKYKVGKLVALTDGASRGNPGKSACAMILFDEKNEELLRRSKKLGVTTNNVAEYEGVLLALEFAEVLGARELEIRLDSELVVKQLSGEYKVKHPALKPLAERTRDRMKHFHRVTVRYVPRKENAAADELANDELDGKAEDP